MAARARTKSVKLITLGARRLIWISFMGMVFFGFLLSLERLNPHVRKPPGGGGFDFEGSGKNLSETVLLYSQFTPTVRTERERIKTFLKATDFGKINVKEVLYSKKALREHARPRSERAWMLPFASRAFEAHMPKFVQLAKTWLGDYVDLNPRVMQDLVQTVKLPLDRNAAYWAKTIGSNEDGLKWENKYRSCAVVGNSGLLLNANYGEQIDSHETVIRLNNAEVYQHSKHVGSKTTMSFLNSNIFLSCSVNPECWCSPYGVDVPIVLYICQAKHLLQVTRCLSKQRSALVLTPSLLDALCAAVVKWYSVTNFVQTTGRPVSDWDSVHNDAFFHYSSGMQAVVLALGICESVDMFGFGKSAHAKHHYHTGQTAELKLHDYAAEYLFYDDLVHNRTVPFLSDAGRPIPPVRVFF